MRSITHTRTRVYRSAISPCISNNNSSSNSNSNSIIISYSISITLNCLQLLAIVCNCLQLVAFACNCFFRKQKSKNESCLRLLLPLFYGSTSLSISPYLIRRISTISCFFSADSLKETTQQSAVSVKRASLGMK